MSKGTATRGSILDAALQEASVVGFGGLSIGSLAERTNMSKSGVFAHFKSKEQLQLATLAHGRLKFRDLVLLPARRAAPGLDRLREVVRRWLIWEDTALTGGCVFVAGSVEYDDRPGPMHEAIGRDHRDWREFLTGIVEDAVHLGHLSTATDVRTFVFQFQGLMLAYQQEARFLRSPDAADLVEAAFETLVRVAAPPRR